LSCLITKLEVIDMGWKSDWLYGLIFSEVEALWKRALQEWKTSRDNYKQPGDPPACFVVQQCANGDWQFPDYGDPVIRQWQYEGTDFRLLTSNDLRLPEVAHNNRMFWRVGQVRFHIAASRKHVIFSYVIGPRYCRGSIFQVVGQGKRGKLKPAAGPGWIS